MKQRILWPNLFRRPRRRHLSRCGCARHILQQWQSEIASCNRVFLTDALRNVPMTGPNASRENAFFNQPGENTNIAPVVFKSEPAKSSVGWNAASFFQQLGDPRHTTASAERMMEQEYLLQGMVKGAMSAAAQIASKYRLGISVRPTGVLAHMGIESGNPTKAQEFKNKTSKELDLFLCDEIKWEDIGAVVHYNPRVGWSSGTRPKGAIEVSQSPNVTDEDWLKKRKYIETVRLPSLKSRKLDERLRFWPKAEQDWGKLRDLFRDRAKEFAEEDHEYRRGHYKEYAHIEGPYVRLKARPEMNMVGDHDLFGFTKEDTGTLIHDVTFPHVQKALQSSLDFQAQHGGIWNWAPKEPFHQDIKRKIMSAHSPPNGDPLLHFLPTGVVRAAFYIPATETLESVWLHPGASAWRASTFTGKPVK